MKNNNPNLIPRCTITYVLLTNIDFLIILPLIPVLVGAEHGNVATKVASILSMRIFFSMGSSLFSSILFKKTSYGTLLAIAAISRAIAFFMLFRFDLTSLYLFAGIAGSATGLIRPSVRALLADTTSGTTKTLYFQFLFIAMNAAFVIGPTISRWIMKKDILATIIAYLITIEIALALMMIMVGRHVKPQHNETSQDKPSLLSIERYRHFFSPLLQIALFYEFLAFFGIGFMIACFVLYNKIIPELGDFRHFLLSFEGFAMIVMQLVLLPLFTKLRGTIKMLLVSICFGTGVYLAFTPPLWVVIVGLVVFALAESILLPHIQLLMSKASTSANRRQIYALATCIAALGEICGNFCAGFIIDAPYFSHQPATNGQIVGVLFLFAFVALTLHYRQQENIMNDSI
jgi:MFS family permease